MFSRRSLMNGVNSLSDIINRIFKKGRNMETNNSIHSPFRTLWSRSGNTPFLIRATKPDGHRALKGKLSDNSRFLVLPSGNPPGITVKLIDIPERLSDTIQPCTINFSGELDISTPTKLLSEIEQWIDSNSSNHNPSSSSLTDMDTVIDQLPDAECGIYINESELFDHLENKVKGQSEALKTLAMVVTRHCARTKPSRPAVVFSVGPSGVGKTHTAECLSRILSDLPPSNTGYQYLRLDMTEYQEAHRVSQLIGSPQGYVGHGQGSQLTDALRANPRTIVLFDEIEKAHPAILRVLMNAMDAGRLSTASNSGSGHQIDCSRAIFIFTSNLDAGAILEELDNGDHRNERKVIDEICRRRLKASGIAPEIVGRIGRFLVYYPLSQDIRAEIITLSVADVAQEYGITIKYIEPEVVVSFITQSDGGDFGIRPEKYFIDDELGGLFAQAAQSGSKTIKILGPPYYFEPVVEES